MIVHSASLSSTTGVQPTSSSSQNIFATSSKTITDRINISEAARAALASSGNSIQQSVEARLAEIKTKEALERTDAENKYVLENDVKFRELIEKGSDNLTAAEMDYFQKAAGFVNTMAYLSDDEKQLYDDVVANGNHAAAAALGNIGILRLGGHTAAGMGDTTYDPINTAITAENILKYFRHSVIDESGKAEADFMALARYLENRVATKTTA